MCTSHEVSDLSIIGGLDLRASDCSCEAQAGGPRSNATALQDADCGLAIDPDHDKCNFRRGLALHAMGRSMEACPSTGKALRLETKYKQIKEALMFAERGAQKQMEAANRTR
jgi:hypothetical protein